MTDFEPGQRVRWIHVPRGGYGFPIPVDATVVKIGEKRVTIQVALGDGRSVRRVVRPESLRR